MHVRKLSSIYDKVKSSQKSQRLNHSFQCTVIRTLHKHGLHAGTPHQTPLLTKLNIKGRLEYAKNKYLNRPLEFRKNVFGIMIKLEPFSDGLLVCVVQKNAYEQKNIECS